MMSESCFPWRVSHRRHCSWKPWSVLWATKRARAPNSGGCPHSVPLATTPLLNGGTGKRHTPITCSYHQCHTTGVASNEDYNLSSKVKGLVGAVNGVEILRYPIGRMSLKLIQYAESYLPVSHKWEDSVLFKRMVLGLFWLQVSQLQKIGAFPSVPRNLV